MFDTAQEWLTARGLSSSLATPILRMGLGFLVVFASWLAGVAARRVFRKMIVKIVAKSKTNWDDIAMQHEPPRAQSNATGIRGIESVLSMTG